MFVASRKGSCFSRLKALGAAEALKSPPSVRGAARGWSTPYEANRGLEIKIKPQRIRGSVR